MYVKRRRCETRNAGEEREGCETKGLYRARDVEPGGREERGSHRSILFVVWESEIGSTSGGVPTPGILHPLRRRFVNRGRDDSGGKGVR